LRKKQYENSEKHDWNYQKRKNMEWCKKRAELRAIGEIL
jgi:hypothetical protein